MYGKGVILFLSYIQVFKIHPILEQIKACLLCPGWKWINIFISSWMFFLVIMVQYKERKQKYCVPKSKQGGKIQRFCFSLARHKCANGSWNSVNICKSPMQSSSFVTENSNCVWSQLCTGNSPDICHLFISNRFAYLHFYLCWIRHFLCKIYLGFFLYWPQSHLAG